MCKDSLFTKMTNFIRKRKIEEEKGKTVCIIFSVTENYKDSCYISKILAEEKQKKRKAGKCDLQQPAHIQFIKKKKNTETPL